MAESRPIVIVAARCFCSVFAFCLLLLLSTHRASAEEPTYGFTDGSDGEGIPVPWKVLGHPTAGQPRFRIEDDGTHGKILQLHAKGDQSDGIFQPVEVDLIQTPMVHFAWKVHTHPEGQVGTDRSDAAVKVQLDFGRRGLRRQVLSYIFDPRAKAGRAYDDSSFLATNRAIVLNSGSEKVGQWISHSRNVVNDFRACYGAEPPKLENISIFCDSNDSDSESLGYCTAVTFTAADKAADKKP